MLIERRRAFRKTFYMKIRQRVKHLCLLSNRVIGIARERVIEKKKYFDISCVNNLLIGTS